MKQTTFGGMVLQPGDDIYAGFHDQTDPEAEDIAARFVEFDEAQEWCCTLFSENDYEMQAMNFPSEAALREWLASQNVPVV